MLQHLKVNFYVLILNRWFFRLFDQCITLRFIISHHKRSWFESTDFSFDKDFTGNFRFSCWCRANSFYLIWSKLVVCRIPWLYFDVKTTFFCYCFEREEMMSYKTRVMDCYGPWFWWTESKSFFATVNPFWSGCWLIKWIRR